MPDLGGVEAAVFEKAGLFRACRGVGRRCAELLAARRPRERLPIHLGRGQRLGGEFFTHATGAQFLQDASGPVATLGAATDIDIGEAPVLLQSLARKVVEGGRDLGPLEPACPELALEFTPAVVAPGERVDREVARRPARLVAQASSSSSRSSSTTALPAPALMAAARMLASISDATAGLSLRNSLTLSLPCPMRSPL